MLLKNIVLTIFSLLLVAMGVVGFLILSVVIRGVFIGIECKAGSNKPTPLQEAEMAKIRKAQGFTLVVNEDNIRDVEILLRDIS